MSSIPQVEIAKMVANILPKLATAAFVIAVPVTTVILVKNYIRNTQKNNNYDNATDSEKPEFYAVQFVNALQQSWYDWNVDEEEVYRLLKLMQSKAFFNKVNDSYKKMTTRPLTEDLVNVGGDDYKIVSQLIEKIPN